MQITISAADLARRLCGFTHASGSITLTLEDERIRSQILALLLSTPPVQIINVMQGAEVEIQPGAEVGDGSPSASEPEPSWQCGDILEGDRWHRPILVGYPELWIEVWPDDRAEDFAPRVWSEARAFESLGPFRRIGCVTPEVVQRVRGGDEEAAATIVRTAYPPAEG